MIYQKTAKRKLPPFKNLALDTRRKLFDLINQIGRNEISLSEFEEKFDLILFDSHSRASVIGRNLSGDLSPMTAEDRLLASIIADKEKKFLRKFVEDIRNGRYTIEDGGLNLSPIKQRAVLYTTKLRGTMHESFVNVSPSGAMFEWILIAENNCSDCPSLAAGSPYTSASLPTYPGSGETECITNCRCVLMRDDGVLTESYPYETVDELVEDVI